MAALVHLRVLDDGDGDPAWNMAVDEALLNSGGPPTLRLYGWCPHAVSLGYFQRLQDFADLPAGTIVVRRQTGGGAIHHGDELTFALACDAEYLPGSVGQSYERIHDATLAALADNGVAARRVREGPPPAARPTTRWCFADPGEGDVVVADGRKLLGSAQRRIRVPRARVLHHGSLVLRAPTLTPFVAAVAEQQPIGADRLLRASLVRHLAAMLGMQPRIDRATAAELAAAEQLRIVRYGNEAFTALRP